MTSEESLITLATRLTTEARGLLTALDAALDHQDPEEARAVLRAYLHDAGALLAGLEPSAPSSVPPSRPPRADEPEAAARSWVRGFAKLLADWQLDDAERMAAEPPAEMPERLAGVPALVRGGVRAIRAERHADAHDLMEFLLHARELTPRAPSGRGAAARRRHLVNRSTRSLLHVYLGRIALFKDGDADVALEHFLGAARKAPDDGTVQAALGSYYQARHDYAEALTAYQHSVALGPGLPDGYIGMGRLAEAEDRADEAADWYARALEVAGYDEHGRPIEHAHRRLERLGAPVPPALLLEMARTTPEADTALERLDDALEWTDDPELVSRIELQRGEILASLERSDEAAEAYYQAADNLGEATNEYRAVLLEKALELDASHQPAHWDLAETLRLRSFESISDDERRAYVDRALRTWAHCFGIAPPDRDYAWTYVSRALLSERHIDLGAHGQLELYGDAELWLERAVLAGDDAFRWLHLSRMFRMLDLTSNALTASHRAVAIDGDNLDALTERASALVNAAQFEEAEDVLELALAQDPSSLWLRERRGWVLAYTGRADESLHLTELLLAEIGDRPEAWMSRLGVLALRAQAHHTLEDRVGELGAHEQLVADVPAGEAPRQHLYARSQLVIGLHTGEEPRLGEARRILDALAEEAGEWDAGLMADRGIVRLALGDSTGAELVRTGLDRTTSAADLDEVLSDLELLLHRVQVDARAVIEALRDEGTAMRSSVALPSPEEELRRCTDDRRYGEAATMTLARIHRESRSWSDALAITSQLSEVDRAPHHSQLVDGILQEADASFAAGGGAGERESLELARGAAADIGDGALEAMVHSRLTLAHFRARDSDAAREALTRAFTGFRRAGQDDPAAVWWALCGQLMSGTEEIWDLADMMEAMAASGASAVTPGALPFARHLEVLAPGIERDPDLAHDPRPIVRLGEALIPEDTGPDWSLFSVHLPAMTERVREDTGLTPPGSSFRASLDLTPYEYQVVVSGLSALRGIAVPETDGSGIEPIAAVVEALEGALRGCLEEFVSVEETLELLEDHSLEADQQEPDRLLDRIALLRLTRVVRAMAFDRAPLDGSVLLDAMDEAGSDTAETVARVRRRVWQRLPGNEHGRPRIELPPELERAIADTFDSGSRAAALMTSPQDAIRVERQVADWVMSLPSNAAVVTDSHDLRALLQRLIRMSHPGVPVLARPETAEATLPEAGDTRDEAHAGA